MTLFVGLGVMCLADLLFMTLGLSILGWYLTGFGLAWAVAYPITQTMIIVVFAEALEVKTRTRTQGTDRENKEKHTTSNPRDLA